MIWNDVIAQDPHLKAVSLKGFALTSKIVAMTFREVRNRQESVPKINLGFFHFGLMPSEARIDSIRTSIVKNYPTQ
jgi:hypothetical protein